MEIEIELPYDFEPWPHQRDIFRAFYDAGIRRFCLVMHRRSGKDKLALNLLICEMMRRVGNYCHVFPQRNRARRIIWQGIDSEGRRYTDHFPPELVYRRSEEEMSISMVDPSDSRSEGSIYWCLGSDKDEHLLVGTNPVGIIWSEFAEIPPRMRELALPILRRNGGWEILVYTPRGRNHGYRQYQQALANPEWCTRFLTIHDTCDHQGMPLYSPEEVEADVAAGMSREAADQEYYLDWDSPMPGAYYAEEMRRIDREGRIRRVPYDPDLPTYTAWDLGHNDANAIWWVQPAGREVRVIDYEEGSSIPLLPPVKDVGSTSWIGIVRQKPYRYDHSKLIQPLTTAPYEVHYGPHDLEVHEYSSGKTRYDLALGGVADAVTGMQLLEGIRFTVVPRGTIEDGIAAVRELLGRCVFDGEKCQRGLDALRSYRREWDERGEVFASRPVHDWASNGADAFRYLALGLVPAPIPTLRYETGTFRHMQKLARRYHAGKPVGHQTFRVYRND